MWWPFSSLVMCGIDLHLNMNSFLTFQCLEPNLEKKSLKILISYANIGKRWPQERVVNERDKAEGAGMT